MFDLTGRVAVITGASSGLGANFSRVLAKQGADIVAIGLESDAVALGSLAKDIVELGRQCLVIICDVTQTEQLVAAGKKVKETFGKVDILVNNAGIAISARADRMSDDDWQKVIDVNLTGVFKTSREFGRMMIANRYGRVINIASMFGLIGNTIYPFSNYHAAKGAVINYTRALAVEWAQYNITVNAIGPGYFESEMTNLFINSYKFKKTIQPYCPIGRVGRINELDSTLVYLAADETSYTTGTTLFVDGGWTSV